MHPEAHVCGPFFHLRRTQVLTTNVHTRSIRNQPQQPTRSKPMPLIDSALTDKVTNDDESMRFVSNLATAASTYGLHEVLIAAVAWGMARGQIAGAAAAIESLDRVVAERTAPA